MSSVSLHVRAPVIYNRDYPKSLMHRGMYCAFSNGHPVMCIIR